MRLHGRLWRRVAIGTLLLLTCLPATLAPDTPPISPARILEQLNEASSELVSELRPSQSFPSGIRQEGSSSSAISRAVGRKRGREGDFRPPDLFRNRDGMRYRIEKDSKALVENLTEEIKRRAKAMRMQAPQELIDDIRFKPAHEILGPSGYLPSELTRQLSSVGTTSTETVDKKFAPIVARYQVGQVEYTIQRSPKYKAQKFSHFNVVVTVRQGTELVDRIFLGRLEIPTDLVQASKEQEQDALSAAQRAAVEPARVDPANIGPGGVGQVLQHNEAGLDVEHVRHLVHPIERPRLEANERHLLDLNELPHEHQGPEDE